MWRMEDLIRDFGPIQRWNETNDICWVIAHRGQLDLLKEVRKLGAAWDDSTPRWAIIGGHVDCLEYAIINGCPCPPNMLDLAMMNNKANILEYLLTAPESASKYRESDESYFIWHTAAHGHTECLKLLLRASYKTRGWYDCATAANGGHIECLKVLIDAGCLDSATAEQKSCVVDLAASAGRLDCLRTLYETGCDIDVKICTAAEKGGNEECIRFTNEIFVRNWTDNIFKSVSARQIQEWWLKKKYEPNGAMFVLAKEAFERHVQECRSRE